MSFAMYDVPLGDLIICGDTFRFVCSVSGTVRGKHGLWCYWCCGYLWKVAVHFIGEWKIYFLNVGAVALGQ